MLLSFLAAPALAQTFSPVVATPVLDPIPTIPWFSVSLSHPAVDYSPSLGRFYMVFESEVPGPPAACPAGMTTLGLATSTDGISWSVLRRPLLPHTLAGGQYWDCTSRRPALRIDDVSQRLEIYFVTDNGIGGLSVALDPATGAPIGRTVTPAPLLVPAAPVDSLSVVQQGGEWILAAAIYPDIWIGTFLTLSTPVLDTQAVSLASYGPILSWVDDRFSDADLMCDASLLYPVAMFPAGWDGTDWAISKGIASVPTLWSLSTTPWDSGTVPFDGHSVLGGDTGAVWRWYGESGSIWLDGTGATLGTPRSRTCP